MHIQDGSICYSNTCTCLSALMVHFQMYTLPVPWREVLSWAVTTSQMVPLVSSEGFSVHVFKKDISIFLTTGQFSISPQSILKELWSKFQQHNHVCFLVLHEGPKDRPFSQRFFQILLIMLCIVDDEIVKSLQFYYEEWYSETFHSLQMHFFVVHIVHIYSSHII